MTMIKEFRGPQGWEFSEADPDDKCEFCAEHATYLIGSLQLCLNDLMRLRVEISRMIPFPLNEGT